MARPHTAPLLPGPSAGTQERYASQAPPAPLADWKGSGGLSQAGPGADGWRPASAGAALRGPGAGGLDSPASGVGAVGARGQLQSGVGGWSGSAGGDESGAVLRNSLVFSGRDVRGAAAQARGGGNGVGVRAGSAGRALPGSRQGKTLILASGAGGSGAVYASASHGAAAQLTTSGKRLFAPPPSTAGVQAGAERQNGGVGASQGGVGAGSQSGVGLGESLSGDSRAGLQRVAPNISLASTFPPTAPMPGSGGAGGANAFGDLSASLVLSGSRGSDRDLTGGAAAGGNGGELPGRSGSAHTLVRAGTRQGPALGLPPRVGGVQSAKQLAQPVGPASGAASPAQAVRATPPASSSGWRVYSNTQKSGKGPDPPAQIAPSQSQAGTPLGNGILLGSGSAGGVTGALGSSGLGNSWVAGNGRGSSTLGLAGTTATPG